MTTNKKILIIDDDLNVQKVFKKILNEKKFTSTFVKNIKDVIHNIKNEDMDLVLLDLKLNGTLDIKILEKIRAIDQKIPIILISGYLTLDNIEQASKYGIFSYIRKPLKLNDLNHKIERALAWTDTVSGRE